MIRHIVTTEAARWQLGALEERAENEALEPTGEAGQTVLGFGGCFNEMGWEALQTLPEAQRAELLDALFSPEGANFTFGRVPIGANDFSLEWYSCDEVADDFALEHFTIERDKRYTIPFIREALRRQPGLELFASPWSPPTWMKTKRVYNFGTLRMETPIRKAYARYFVKFVQAYAECGVPVRQIHVQNEPVADQKFPSCKWTGEELRDFIRDDLGPAFREAGLDTELWLGTINGPFLDMMLGTNTPFSEFFDRFVGVVLQDEEARQYIQGVGLQWGGKHILDPLQAAYPELRVMQTESECGDGSNSWEHMEYVFGLMWQYLRHGAERYMYWNLVLAEGSGSTWGWGQNSLVTVNGEQSQLTPEYYLMKHVSRYVQPGAKFLPLRGRWASSAFAFENADASRVVVALNATHSPRTLAYRDARNTFSCVCAPHSLHTFVLEA